MRAARTVRCSWASPPRPRRTGSSERARSSSDKQVDLIVYNDVSRDDVGFDAKENEVVIVSAQGERRVEKAPKEAIAAAILDEVEHLI